MIGLGQIHLHIFSFSPCCFRLTEGIYKIIVDITANSMTYSPYHSKEKHPKGCCLGRQIERHSVTTDRRDGMLKGKKIGMIGGGKMGGALIGGMVSHKIVPAKDIMVSDVVPERLDELRGLYGVRTTSDNLKLCRESNIIILAVKPQTMATVLGEISQAIDKTKTVISIAAGIPIKLIEDRLKKGVRIIRTMPNTPALVSAGVSALAKSKDATEEDLATARCIFDAVGSSVVVQEDLMDTVTGLSGSGPAYVFIYDRGLVGWGSPDGFKQGHCPSAFSANRSRCSQTLPGKWETSR